MGCVLFVAKLPLELSDLNGDEKVKDKIFKAWFEKPKDSDEPDWNYPPTEFTVTLDGCKIQFVRDETLSGRYPDGKVRRIVVGKVLKLSVKRQKLLAERLSKVTVEMNSTLLAERSKAGNSAFKNLPIPISAGGSSL